MKKLFKLNPFSHKQFQRITLKSLTTLNLLGLLCLAPVAEALTINFTNTGGSMTPQQQTALNAAAALWENQFSDPMTVNINVAWLESDSFSSSSVTMSTATAIMKYDMSDVQTAMILDADSTAEENAVLLMNRGHLPVVDISGSRDAFDVLMPMANAKALGLSTGQSSLFGNSLPNNADATVLINSDFTFDLDRSDGINFNESDFVGIFAHEIGHALGFTSVTDWQDANPNFALPPMTLDLWRFFSYGSGHDIYYEDRYIKSNSAKYFDSVLNNIGLSYGMLQYDPECGATSKNCQASHWRDNEGNLMDPTSQQGQLYNLTSEDIHALDYIGYNPYIFLTQPTYFLAFNFDWDSFYCNICSFDSNSKTFSKYPKAPSLKSIKPPFKGANLAMKLAFETKTKGFENRSAIGVARFESASKNRNPMLLKTPDTYEKDTWEEFIPNKNPMNTIPARLSGFYFESEGVNGPRFSFNAVIPEQGIQFNPHLGRYGGFQIGGFINAMDDKDVSHADAGMTFALLLKKTVRGEKAQFTIDIKAQDNHLRVKDYSAFGLTDPNHHTKSTKITK